MKNCIAFILTGLYFTACSPDTRKAEVSNTANTFTKPQNLQKLNALTIQQFDLRPGRAGMIRIGMPVDSLQKLVPAENLRRIETNSEGLKSVCYEIRNAKTGNQLLFVAEESGLGNTRKISRLRILSPKFSTKENFRVGTTFAEVKKAYSVSSVGIGEADFVAISKKQRMSFALDISKFPPKHLDKIKLEDIPDNTTVTGILLF